MTQQMIITKHTDNKTLDLWENDTKNDTILLNTGGSGIYYSQQGQKRVHVDASLRILSSNPVNIFWSLNQSSK